MNKGREREVSFMGGLGLVLLACDYFVLVLFLPPSPVTLRRRDARHRFSWVNTRPLAHQFLVWLYALTGCR